MENSPRLEASLLAWFSDFAPVGILVTDAQLTVVTANRWLLRHLEQIEIDLIGRSLIEAIPDLASRGFDRYYRAALRGETRVLSHRFHKYLIPVPCTLAITGFDVMQQKATIAPLFDGDSIIGTITMIEDVSKRVAREQDLNAQIEDREALLARERSAREIAEENSRLRDHNELLNQQGQELLYLTQSREGYLHRIITSQEDERKRIARDLHDHLGQQLTALRLSLSLLRDDLHKGRNPFRGLDTIETIARTIDSDVDFISRELRPSGLDDLGLEESIRQFVAQWSRHFGIRAEFHSLGFNDVSLPPDIAINLYRIMQEALNNISKHARANLVSVLLENRDGSIVLIIEDDGMGFEPDSGFRSKDGSGGAGIIGMKERVALICGRLEIESSKGRGTTIYTRVDLPANKVEYKQPS